MADWLTVDGMKVEFPASRVNKLAGNDDAVIELALETAEARMRSKLARRYTTAQLPAAGEAPRTLLWIGYVFALYALASRHDTVSDDITSMEHRAAEALRDIAASSASASLEGDPAVDTARPEVVLVTRGDDAQPPMTLDDLGGGRAGMTI